MERLARVEMRHEKTGEQDFIREVGIKSWRDDLDEELRSLSVCLTTPTSSCRHSIEVDIARRHPGVAAEKSQKYFDLPAKEYKFKVG